MAHRVLRSAAVRSSLIVFALAVGGLAGCGGSDANTPPKTPEPPPADTTVTTTTAAPPMAMPSSTDTTGATGAPMGAGATATTPGAGAQGSAMGSSMNAGTATSASPSAQPALTDEQIAAVTNAIDNGEIDQAKEAQKKAKDPKVKQFAQHMITDHTAAMKQAQAILKKGNMTPSDNAVAQQAKSDGQRAMSQIQSAMGPDFDKTYIETQIQEHQQALDTLDKQLIPAASNAELKAHLQKVRDKVASHLSDAQSIRSSLK